MEPSEHITQIATVLALIVVLVVGLGFLVKRLNRGGFASGGEIKVVASSLLGPKERVLLLEVRGRQVLVGMNAQCIAPLAEFPAPEQADVFHTVLEEARA